jgi:hypothetical protein
MTTAKSSDAKRTDIESILIIGRTDHHQPGVRVRLLGRAGVPRCARRAIILVNNPAAIATASKLTSHTSSRSHGR